MRATGRTPKVWIWGALVALTIGMVGAASPANAVPGNGNSQAATATASPPAEDTVVVTYSVNRAAKQINQVTCTLDGAATPCGTQTATTNKLTSYSFELTGLQNGVHALAVAFTLTGGRTATATAELTIDYMPTLDEACADLLGGVVVDEWRDLWDWACVADPFTGTVPASEADEFVADAARALIPYCDGPFVAPVYTTDTHLLMAAVVCSR